MNFLPLNSFVLEIVVCVALILVIRFCFRGVIGPQTCRMLWFVLILRCLIPFSIATPYHPISLMPHKTAVDILVEAATVPVHVHEPQEFETALESEKITETIIPVIESEVEPIVQKSLPLSIEAEISNPDASFNTTKIMWFAWATGAFMFFVFVINRNRIIVRKLCKGGEPAPDWLQNMCEKIATEMKIRTKITLIVSKHIDSPCLLGVFRPRILIPKILLQTNEENCRTLMQHVFMHELTHLKQGDIRLSWYWTVVLAMHWFNPILWWVGKMISFDCEAACDAKVLERISVHNRDGYGHSLLEILNCLKNSTAATPSVTAIVEKTSNLEKRLIMITKFRKPTVVQTIIGTLLIAGLTIVTLTTYAQIAPDAKETASTKDVKPNVDKKKMIGAVEDFFKINFHDITARKPISWSDVSVDENGNMSITHEFEATIWDKDKILERKTWMFDKNGQYISVENAEGFPKPLDSVAALDEENVTQETNENKPYSLEELRRVAQFYMDDSGKPNQTGGLDFEMKIQGSRETKIIETFLLLTQYGDFDTASGLCTNSLKEQATNAKTKAVFDEIVKKYGKIKSVNFVSKYLIDSDKQPLAEGDIIQINIDSSDFDQLAPKSPYNLRRGDTLRIELGGLPEDGPHTGEYIVLPLGDISLGTTFGKFQVAGKTIEQVETEILESLKKQLKEPKVSVTLTGIGSIGNVNATVKIQSNGNISLGSLGKFNAKGISVTELEAKITKKVDEMYENGNVSVSPAYLGMGMLSSLIVSATCEKGEIKFQFTLDQHDKIAGYYIIDTKTDK